MGVQRQVVEDLIKSKSSELKEQVDNIGGTSTKNIKKVITDATKAILKEVKNVCGKGDLETTQQRTELRRRANRYLSKKKKIYTQPNLTNQGANERYPLIDAIDEICAELDNYTFIDESELEKNEPNYKPEVAPVEKKTRRKGREKLFYSIRQLLDDKEAEDTEQLELLDRFHGLLSIFVQDFLRTLNDKLEEEDFDEQISLSQIRELGRLCQRIYSNLTDLIDTELDNNDISFEALRNAIIKELKSFSFTFQDLPEETMDIFKKNVIILVIEILEATETIEDFWGLDSSTGFRATLENIQQILLEERILYKDSKDKEEEFPMSENEVDFIISYYAKEKNGTDDIEFWNELLEALNKKFHGGISFRTLDEIETVLIEFESSEDENEEDISTETEDLTSGISDLIDDEALEETGNQMIYNLISKTGTEGELAKAEEEPKEESKEESPKEEKEEVKPVIAEAQKPDYAKEIAETATKSRRALESALESIGLLDELMKFHQGLIAKAKEHHELRNPSIKETENLRTKLAELITVLRKFNDDVASEIAYISTNKTRLLLKAQKINNMDDEDIDINDPNIIQIFDDLSDLVAHWNKADKLFDEAHEICEELKDINRKFNQLVRNVNEGDTFFDRKIFEYTLGADPKILLGSEHSHLFDKDNSFASLIKIINSLISDYRLIKNQVNERKEKLDKDTKERLVKAMKKLEKFKNVQEDKVTDKEEKRAKVTDVEIDGNRLVEIEYGNEVIRLSKTQIQAILATTKWGMKNKVWGLRVDKDELNTVIQRVFGGELISNEDLDAELRPLSEIDDNIYHLSPKKNRRSTSEKLFIRWRHRNKKHVRVKPGERFLPTHKAYELIEKLPEEYKLTPDQEKVLRTIFEEQKAQRMKNRSQFKKKSNK